MSCEDVQAGWHTAEPGHPVLGNGTEDQLREEEIPQQHEGAAGHEGAEHLRERVGVVERKEDEGCVGVGEAEALRDASSVREERLFGHHDALGRSGRAARKDDGRETADILIAVRRPTGAREKRSRQQLDRSSVGDHDVGARDRVDAPALVGRESWADGYEHRARTR